ncbi:MAG: hypothetical protein KDN22_03715 [Verrucomicrobiae bacterium]|nr:hypothetical protein [Verrucomicrobiae bacterium]
MGDNSRKSNLKNKNQKADKTTAANDKKMRAADAMKERDVAPIAKKMK